MTKSWDGLKENDLLSGVGTIVRTEVFALVRDDGFS